MKYIKAFESEKFKYKVGDFVKCIIDGENNGKSVFGKIINSEIYEYDGNTIFFTILKDDGKITSVWQSPTIGEIKDYWDMDDEHFNIIISANNYNL